MEILQSIFKNWFPTVLTAVLFFGVYQLAKWILDRQIKGHTDKGLIRSIVLFLIVLVGMISIILAIPMSESQKGSITSLIGIVLSAVLGLSSTTFIGNALAGIALRLRKSFKPGDFITVNDIFGRVTEQGLFHTEIQTIDRDLTTLPNMTLATNSVKVTRSSGTFISVDCSLGYDVNRLKIEEALLNAANKCGLEDSFVHIISLGDFSIVYRVHGLLKDIKSIVSAKSKLKGYVIDALHSAGIEIVSPTFMNQRRADDTVFIPQSYKTRDTEVLEENTPENLIFDKAEEAEGLEKRKELLAEVEGRIKNEKEQLEEVKDDEIRKKLEKKLKASEELQAKISDKIESQVNELDKTK
jgi:small-conductance mechanosensitive channel